MLVMPNMGERLDETCVECVVRQRRRRADCSRARRARLVVMNEWYVWYMKRQCKESCTVAMTATDVAFSWSSIETHGTLLTQVQVVAVITGVTADSIHGWLVIKRGRRVVGSSLGKDRPRNRESDTMTRGLQQARPLHHSYALVERQKNHP